MSRWTPGDSIQNACIAGRARFLSRIIARRKEGSRPRREALLEKAERRTVAAIGHVIPIVGNRVTVN